MRSIRRGILSAAAAAITVVAVAALSPGHASAAPLSANAAADLARSLGGTRTAGTYLDAATGQMVINVTDAATAEKARTAGAVPLLVPRSSHELDRLMAQLDSRIPGTAWAVGPVSNQRWPRPRRARRDGG